MAEWSIAAVLKTVELRGSGGSNPSLSAGRLSQEQPKSRQVLQINDLWDFFHVRVSGCKAIKKPILDIVALPIRNLLAKIQNRLRIVQNWHCVVQIWQSAFISLFDC